MRKNIFLSTLFLIFFTSGLNCQEQIKFNDLPFGAKEVITKIKNGVKDWPFPDKDGSRFGNYEKVLPANTNYKEYTVLSKSMYEAVKRGQKPNRGAMRIIYDTKNKIFYFTRDHYKTFQKVAGVK